MKKNKTKFYASPFIMIGLIIMLILMVGIWVFTLFFPNVDGRAIDNLAGFVSENGWFLILLQIFFAGVCPILGFILTCHQGFSVFEISEKGVKTSLFKVFRKTEIKWDEMQEIRCYGRITLWVLFSKTYLENMPYNDIIKRKDVLKIEYSDKIVELINQYSNKEIINLPENNKSV